MGSSSGTCDVMRRASMSQEAMCSERDSRFGLARSLLVVMREWVGVAYPAPLCKRSFNHVFILSRKSEGYSEA
jgi:hypothetical protein